MTFLDRLTRCLFHRVGLTCPLVCLSASAAAATFVVNTTIDSVDKDPTDDVCLDTNNRCSLRAAIMQANAQPGPDTIKLGKGVYQLTIPGTDEDNAETGDLDILYDLTLVGEGPNNSIIDGGQLDRVLDIRGNASVDIHGVTIRQGKNGEGNGGGIVIEGGNTVTIKNSAISDNWAYMGGGLCIDQNAQADVTIESTIISDNGAAAGGGVTAIGGASTTRFINTTVSGNKAVAIGGGLYVGGGVNISNSTIANNNARASGAGVFSSGGVTLRNSLLAKNYTTNTADASNCYSTPFLLSEGYNLIDNNRLCTFAAISSDIVGTPSAPIDPLLGPLADNGGPTLTHALLPKSPAIGAGNPAPPGSGGNACEATDQRGVSRLGRGVCDIGAFESTDPGDTSTGTNNNSGDVGNPFAGKTATAAADQGIADTPRNPFVGGTRTSQTDTKTPHPLEHQPQPPEISARAGQAKPDLPGERERERGQAAADGGLKESGDDASVWQSVRAMKYDDEWINVKEIDTKQDGLLTNISILGPGAVIFAGVVNFYVRSLSFLGIFFSSPLLISFDPVPIVFTSKKERARRKKWMKQAADIEDRDGRLGALLDDKPKANSKL